jgi:hypothetical protein
MNGNSGQRYVTRLEGGETVRPNPKRKALVFFNTDDKGELSPLRKSG